MTGKRAFERWLLVAAGVPPASRAAAAGTEPLESRRLWTRHPPRLAAPAFEGIISPAHLDARMYMWMQAHHSCSKLPAAVPAPDGQPAPRRACVLFPGAPLPGPIQCAWKKCQEQLLSGDCAHGWQVICGQTDLRQALKKSKSERHACAAWASDRPMSAATFCCVAASSASRAPATAAVCRCAHATH